MGNCGNKGSVQTQELIARKGSVDRKGRKDGSSSEPMRVAQGSGDCSLLELFPNARVRCSLFGVATEQNQKGFSDKLTARGGEAWPSGTRVGYACKKGLKPEGPNQDDFCIFSIDGTVILGVFDGHGPYGHDISNFAQGQLPRNFVRDVDFEEDPEKALCTAFPLTHRHCAEAQERLRYDCALSGTTATLAMQRDGYVYLGYVGDCRAVLARAEGSEVVQEDLTVDHKPTRDAEWRRIQQAGGQVRRLEGDIPHRVFLSGKMFPGLTMTRSIGDTLGAAAGIVSTPDVRTMKVQRDWRFLLLCSDGVWEFLNSQEAVEVVARYSALQAQTAAEALASEAWNRWIREENNVVDDITVLVLWFGER